MGRFDEVEVFETLTNRWVGGFELADTGPEGSDAFALRRLSDGVVLPEVVPATRIRPAHSAPPQR